MKLGMNNLFTPGGDFTWTSLRERWRGFSPSRQREKERQAWERRRSEQIAKENQERRQGRMHAGGTTGTGFGGGGGVFRHGTNNSLFGNNFGNNNNNNAGTTTDSPVPTPATPVHLKNQQTGMLGIYQDMNIVAGTRRARTPEQVV